MNLENAVKYHFAKSSQINDTPRCTSSDTLTGTDVMAAMGQTQSRAAMGYSAFLGKMGISKHDSERAINLLTEHALKNCDSVPALRKLESDIKPSVMQILAIYAYADYSRSAASVRQCECCAGQGFIEAEKFSMKTTMPNRLPQNWEHAKALRMVTPSEWETKRNVREVVRALCSKCKGKKVVSTACRDCKGRGKAINEKETKKQGVPVTGDCKQCGGRGYERIPSTDAYKAISCITESISLATWEKSVKRFYEMLIVKLEVEEAWADASLRKATA